MHVAPVRPDATNDDFNLSTAQSTNVLELAEVIWHKVHKDHPKPFAYVSDPGFEHDVAKRVPSTANRGVTASTLLGQPVRGTIVLGAPTLYRFEKSGGARKLGSPAVVPPCVM